MSPEIENGDEGAIWAIETPTTCSGCGETFTDDGTYWVLRAGQAWRYHERCIPNDRNG